MKLINGKELEKKIREGLKNEVIKLKKRNINPKLAVIMVGHDKASEVYVRNKSNVGTIFGIADLVKDLWTNRPQKRERKKMNKTDWIAIGLTIVVVFIIGVILWFIPFTNGWMRQLLFENALFNFIGGLFS